MRSRVRPAACAKAARHFVKIFYSFDPPKWQILTIFGATEIPAANIAATRELRKPLIFFCLHARLRPVCSYSRI